VTSPAPLPGAWDDFDAILAAGVETIPQLIVHQTARFRDQVLHRKKDFGIWQRYTWGDVLAEVRALAMGMAARGVKAGDTVAIVGENEPELFWSQYAAQSIGAKAVCLYPDLTAAQMEYVLQHSEAVMVVCEDQEQVDKALELEAKLPAVQTIVYWDERGMWKYAHPKLRTLHDVQAQGQAWLAEHPSAFDLAVRAGRADDIAVLSYTSGTTGLPKACIMTHRYLLEAPARMIAVAHFKPFTRYLSYISPAWAAEQYFGMSLGLLVPFVVNFPEEPETVQENIREIGTEALMLSPRQWESLAALVEAKMMDAGRVRQALYRIGMAIGRRVNLARLYGKPLGVADRLLGRLADAVVLRHLRDNLGLQSAYLAVSGGSGMAPDVFRFFHAMGVPLRNLYGATEIGIVTLHQGASFDLETVGSWLPVSPKLGTPLEYKVADDGELLVRGGIGFAGYYKNPEATVAKQLHGWYRTGDVVHLTASGDVVYLERADDMRELATGHRYPPQFIEDRLRFSPFIKDAMTLGDQDATFVAAFINIDATTLGRWAEQRGIGYTTFADLSQNAQIRELIRQEIDRVNAFLPANSRVVRFINLPKELDPDEDELTRTRKLRRKHLEQKYVTFIAAIRSGQTEFPAEVPVKYQDGRTGMLTATVHVTDVGASASPSSPGAPAPDHKGEPWLASSTT
jgi:long-chain acyl-CoA synthetase